jgi:hypothetical protein
MGSRKPALKISSDIVNIQQHDEPFLLAGQPKCDGGWNGVEPLEQLQLAFLHLQNLAIDAP